MPEALACGYREKGRITMKQITYQEAFQTLRRAGFVGAEIDRLYQLRRTYQTSELDQSPLDLCQLQFIRWLVATGRLTDQLPEVEERAVPPTEDPEGDGVAPRSRGPFLWFRR